MTSASTPPLNAEEVRELVETHQAGVWRYLRALGCEPSLADDITQDTFLSVLQKPFQQYSKSATAAYLRRVAYNRFVTLHRRSGKVTTVEDVEQLDADWTQFVDDDGGEQMLDALRDCLAGLSERARRALQMRFGERESRANIAAELEITEHGAKNLMQRAKQKLRGCIEKKSNMKPEDHDPLLDAFLEEALGQSAPPDLSDRIVRAWSEQNTSVGDNGSTVDAPPVAPPPVATPQPVTPIALDTSRRVKSTAPTWPRYVITLAVALAILTAYIAATSSNNDDLANNNGESTPVEDAPAGPPSITPEPETGLAHQDPPQKQPRGGGDQGPSAFDQPAPFEQQPGPGSETNRIADAKPELLSNDTLLATINGQLENTWAVNNVTPTELATDAEYCRRVFLALIGRIPTVPELEAFLAREEDNKRILLAERLQQHPAYRPYYVANWTSFWTNLLIGRTGGQKDSLADRQGLETYLAAAIRDGKPYDEMVRDLITAEGANRPDDDDFNGAVNFLLDGYTSDATLAASRTARVFLGKQIQCVQCHNHPTNEGWSQNRFWEFNAFFRQMHVTRGKDGRAVLRDRSFAGAAKDDDEAEIYYEQLDGRKRVAYPVFFDGQAISKSGDLSEVRRREELAKFVVASKEFSRAAVNRMWARFFQFGLSNPVDDMGSHQAPEHPELLELLAEQFEASDFNLDKLVLWIATTDAFQRSSKVSDDSLADNPVQGLPLFSRYYTRQLTPEAVYDSLRLAAIGRQRETGSTEVVGQYVRAQRAWVGEFSKNMKTDEGQETDTFSGDIRQSVVVMTSPLMKQAVSNRLGGVLNQVTSSSMSTPEKIEHLFMAALSRKPSKREMVAISKIIDPRDPNAGLQDVWWALLNSNEFILDH